MSKIISPLVFLTAHSRLPFYFIRAFAPVFILLLLIMHQFLFSSFIDPNLTVFGYALCCFVLLFESLFLFFYHENQKRDFNLFLFFLSALFLVLLTVLLGDLSFLFFVFFLVFLQVFSLFLLGKALLAFVFLLYFSFLLPIAFIWLGGGMHEGRLSLAVLTNATLFFIFSFSFLFCFALNFLTSKNTALPDTADGGIKSYSDLPLSLNLSKKLKLILSALIKRFSEMENNEISQFSSFQQGQAELKKLKYFILDFIEVLELNRARFSFSAVDVQQLLNESLTALEGHKRRPQNLELNVEALDSFKIKGDPKYLKKCFENILVNSFEAFQNEDKPVIKIYCLKQKSQLSIQFLDNGHGIEEEDSGRLFNPLFSKRFGLRGLGLFYVQKVIHAHGGEVKLERMKEWTKVLIRLPLIEAYYDKFDFLKILKISRKAS